MVRPGALCALCTLALASGSGSGDDVASVAVRVAVEGGGELLGASARVEAEAESAGAAPDAPPGRFVPTDEWQAVEPGQPVPAGLHVRMDMATGRNEARLLQDVRQPPPPLSDTGRLSDLTERRLRDLRTAAGSAPAAVDTGASAHAGRRAEEAHNPGGPEPLRRLLGRLDEADAGQEDELLFVLDDLDYALHEAEAARALVRMGGLSALARLLDSTSDRVAAAALGAIGSAAQSNPPVQSALLHGGLLSDLSALWRRAGPHKRLGGRLLYALSAMLRGSAGAQIEFLRSGGGRLLASALDSAVHGGRGASLASDLLAERLSGSAQCGAPPTGERECGQHAALEGAWRLALADYRLCDVLAGRLASLPADGIDECDAYIRLALALRPHCERRLHSAAGNLAAIRQQWGRTSGGLLATDDGPPALLDALLAAIGGQCDGDDGLAADVGGCDGEL